MASCFLPSSVHSFTHSFIQQKFTESLLYSQWTRSGATTVNAVARGGCAHTHAPDDPDPDFPESTATTNKSTGLSPATPTATMVGRETDPRRPLDWGGREGCLF